ncbi:DUF3037 domain-containing protein [Micromonospora sp. NPDC000089]|uniref:DUF3037 domain-containing protein n=1 Tax=unclassified Micromonospora TaxID=2617518 RepID=UPI00368EAB25
MRSPFEYALIRAVPRVERGEQINVGVILYCQAMDFLSARTHLDERRLRALSPDVDVEQVTAALGGWDLTCAGGEHGGPAAAMRLGERFRWLTAPRSTLIQPGPVHTGLTADPATDLDRLLTLLVH